MAGKCQYQGKDFSHSQSSYDFKVVRDRCEQDQQGQRMRSRPASADSQSSGTADRDRLRSRRRLPSLPDSGAQSLYSSTFDLDHLPPKGASLFQSLFEATKSGEELAEELRKAETEKVVLREQNQQLQKKCKENSDREEVQELQQQALDRIRGHCDYMLGAYLNISPNRAMEEIKKVKALANLDPSALSSSGDHRSGRDVPRKTNSGKNRQQACTSGTDADIESTSSSTPPSRDGSGSDDMASCKEEESVAHSVAHYKGSSDIGPVHTD